jgi:hypothetical protein
MASAIATHYLFSPPADHWVMSPQRASDAWAGALQSTFRTARARQQPATQSEGKDDSATYNQASTARE